MTDPHISHDYTSPESWDVARRLGEDEGHGPSVSVRPAEARDESSTFVWVTVSDADGTTATTGLTRSEAEAIARALLDPSRRDA